jgi:predicted mannosyl-3-phosphoglycerate phosphatase (HAD superfamily)
MVESSYTIGEKKKAIEVAIKLIHYGMLDTKSIANITGLPENEIEILREIAPADMPL